MADINTLHVDAKDVRFFGKIYEYPDGSYDLIGSTKPIFGAGGWENSGTESDKPKPKKKAAQRKQTPDPEDVERARRRARACVRRLALANDFRWFVTLTIDPKKIDSFDPVAVVKRMSQWTSNQVKRRGLCYVLVPEYHKSGRIHFHGFFNDCLKAVDSGHTDKAGHKIYNLPGWDYGFTTAIELYGNYHSAVAYVCKYIGKDSEKIGGRWYYSGGKLAKPVEKYVDKSAWDIAAEFDNAWVKEVPGAVFAGVNGVKGDENDEG